MKCSAHEIKCDNIVFGCVADIIPVVDEAAGEH